jgi:hypothetical protein
MGRGLELASNGASPVVCSYTDCGAYREDGAPPTRTPRIEPMVFPAQTELLEPTVCRTDGDHACRALGTRATAAFRNEIAEDGGRNFPALHDLSAVGIGTTIWDIASDTSAPLRSPSEGLTAAVTLASAGNAFVAGWLGKDGCTTAVVVDGHGVNHGDPFPDGNVAPLDDHRFVVMPACDHTLRVLDIASGKVLGAVELPAGAHAAKIQRVDAHTAALLWVPPNMEAQLAWVHAPEDQPPTLGNTITIPRCPHP